MFSHLENGMRDLLVGVMTSVNNSLLKNTLAIHCDERFVIIKIEKNA